MLARTDRAPPSLIVSAPINTLLEASNDPDVIANGYVTEIDYPKYGKRLKVHGTLWQFSETPAQPGIAPELGGHKDACSASRGTAQPKWRICGPGGSSEPHAPGALVAQEPSPES